MNSDKDICPVCGMNVDFTVTAVERYKIYYRFCSEQCRETFTAHPGLYSGRRGVNQSALVKQRTLRLAEPLDSEVAESLTTYLGEMMGMKEVTVAGDKVHLIYDLLQVTEAQVEKALIEVGVQLGGGWLGRFRRAWVHDGEENELDNLTAPPAPCCNKLPPGIK